jgi:disease resistance protein RPS2
LKDAKDSIEEKIQLGELESKRLTEQAKRWLDSVRSAEDESHRINNKYEGRRIHIFGCSWNCFFNYTIGRRATKKMRDADDLNKKIPQDDSIFSLLPPVGRELPLPPNIVGQDEYRDKVVGCIKHGSMSLIGICGMGGAGKITLLKQLNNVFSCAAEAHEFDHVIYVEVGHQQNLSTVQRNIAAQLGLALGPDESSASRSASLYNFLKERKFLLLMDELWQTVDLVKVGVPQAGSAQIGPQNRQMIIITTRLQHVCHGMQAHAYVIVIQRLKSDQAWSLFEVNAGHGTLTNSNSQIRGYAKSIVEKCEGLPLALKIVGKAMASKRSEHEWEHSAMLLQVSVPQSSRCRK